MEEVLGELKEQDRQPTQIPTTDAGSSLMDQKAKPRRLLKEAHCDRDQDHIRMGLVSGHGSLSPKESTRHVDFKKYYPMLANSLHPQPSLARATFSDREPTLDTS